MAMLTDPYHDFAGRYDLFFDDFGTLEEDYADFFRTLFDRHRVRRVLDCACGTGRDLLLFHRLGCEVHGSDISEAMLGVAAENLSRFGVTVPLGRADFRELSPAFAGSFDAVVCLSSSLPHVPEENERIRALQSMGSVLREGGILVLSQGITDGLLRVRPRFIPVLNRPDVSRIFVLDYGKETVTVHVLDLFHTEERRDFFTATFEYPILLEKDYRRMLSAADFGTVEIYGNFSFAPYDENSEKLIIVARR